MSETTKNGALGLAFDPGDGIATLTLQMSGTANKINEEFAEGMAEALQWALEQKGLNGIVIGSAHKNFCVGADIDMLYKERDPAVLYHKVRELQQGFRKLETCGVPVVAAITGSALGGGCELTLACNRRIALDDPQVQIGLPEVNLGVFPGGGGTQRLPRMLGLQKALEIIAQGQMLRAPRALKAGLLDELQPTAEAVHQAAREWIAANPDVKQPWDRRGFSMPPPQPGTADARDLLLAGAAMTYKKTAGAFAAPEAAISAVHEGTLLNIDRGMEVEARRFAALAVSDQAKDMIRTLWYHRTAAEKHQDLPSVEEQGIERVGILGAGMMGAALGWVCANAGYRVVIKDIKQEPLEAAREHCDKLTGKRARHLDEAGQKELLDRVAYTLELGELEGCDLVIEAVFEDREIKRKVTEATEAVIPASATFASNTSTLPITGLAEASQRPEQFIGMHFFSPVEQMPLLEIIQGGQTDEQTVGRCLAFCKKLKKLPIVVNDGYGFYTTRVFSTYLMEAVQLLAEGHNPALLEWAARSAGMVVGPLQVFDEVTLTLVRHAIDKGRSYTGERPEFEAGFGLLRAMVDEHQRGGRAAGAGFYNYDGRGKRAGLWPGLADLQGGPPEQTGLEYLGQRVLLSQAVEAVRVLESGVLQRKRDAEVGAIFGIGFAPNTGGPLSYLDRMGIPAAIERLDQLAAASGPRFTPPKMLREMARRGENFFEPV
jgi:3-hydroxyacyl-CoA dehydrogenase/enoyl-CoA hydratase/3-hydroxybutyryl-CoA epimerase